MEFVRSCYQSSWYLFREFPVTTLGRYYFCSPLTPAVPWIHNYGSKNWSDRNHPLDQSLGEDLLQRQNWDDGIAPPVVPGPVALGNEICFRDGETIEHAVGLDDIVDGLPRACFVKFDVDLVTWQLVAGIDTCQMRKFYAACLVWTYIDNVAAIDAAFFMLTGAPFVRTTFDGSLIYPAFHVMRYQRTTVVLVSGTANYQQFALEALYSLIRPTDFGILGTNTLWASFANLLLNYLVTAGCAPGDRVLIVGHSYGAASSLIAVARLVAAATMTEVRYMTFGCPKVGNTDLVRLVDRASGVNVVNDDDIVPVLPPDFLQLDPVVRTLGLPNLFVWIDWFRPGSVQIFDAQGELVQRFNPPLDFDALMAITLNVLGGIDLPLSNGHMIGEYKKRALVKCPNPGWPISIALNSLIGTG